MSFLFACFYLETTESVCLCSVGELFCSDRLKIVVEIQQCTRIHIGIGSDDEDQRWNVVRDDLPRGPVGDHRFQHLQVHALTLVLQGLSRGYDGEKIELIHGLSVRQLQDGRALLVEDEHSFDAIDMSK